MEAGSLRTGLRFQDPSEERILFRHDNWLLVFSANVRGSSFAFLFMILGNRVGFGS